MPAQNVASKKSITRDLWVCLLHPFKEECHALFTLTFFFCSCLAGGHSCCLHRADWLRLRIGVVICRLFAATCARRSADGYGGRHHAGLLQHWQGRRRSSLSCRNSVTRGWRKHCLPGLRARHAELRREARADSGGPWLCRVASDRQVWRSVAAVVRCARG